MQASELLRKYQKEMAERKYLFNKLVELKGNIRLLCREAKLFELKKEVTTLKEDKLQLIRDSKKLEETIFQQKEIKSKEQKINNLQKELAEVQEKYQKLLDFNLEKVSVTASKKSYLFCRK